MIRPLAAIAAAFLLPLASASAASAGPVTVLIEGVRSASGHVVVELCRRATFLGDRCDVTAVAPATKGETAVTIEAPAGVYAIQAFHDRNDDLKVNRGVLGIPTEDVGFSRNAPLGLHGPSFDRAAFDHTDGPQTVTLNLRHF